MSRIDERIDISAPPLAVWHVLVNFSQYKVWNPFIIEMNGPLALNKLLQERVRLPNGKMIDFQTTLLEINEPTRLVWRGHYIAPWLFCGTHEIILEPLDDGAKTCLIQRENYSGLAAFLINICQTREGYRQMNEALKNWVERHS